MERRTNRRTETLLKTKKKRRWNRMQRIQRKMEWKSRPLISQATTNWKQKQLWKQVKTGLSAHPSTVSSTIKNGIKAIFGMHNVDNKISEEDAARISKIADNIHCTNTLVRDITERMERVQHRMGLGVEALLRGLEQGAMVELGHCQELIACYHQIDFSTGSHGGRCDNEHCKDIGKCLLSCLFS